MSNKQIKKYNKKLNFVTVKKLKQEKNRFYLKSRDPFGFLRLATAEYVTSSSTNRVPARPEGRGFSASFRLE